MPADGMHNKGNADASAQFMSMLAAALMSTAGGDALAKGMGFDAGVGAVHQDAVVRELVKSFQSPIETAHLLGIGDLQKSTFSQSGSPTTGLTAYDLEPGAKNLYPVLTPLRNAIPRVSGKGGIEASWKAVTAINTNNISIGVTEGRRGGVIDVTVKEFSASYKGIGLEGSGTFEAVYAGEGYDDIRARITRSTLESMMIAEEALILCGNGSLALGVTPTPTVVVSGGGALPAGTYSVIAVALTRDGLVSSSVPLGIPQVVARANADGTTTNHGGGSAQKSAAANTGAIAAASQIDAALPTAVPGAFGYAWYWGAPGAEVLGAITNVPKVNIAAVATGVQTAAALTATDNSSNATLYNGLMTLASVSGSGAYFSDLGGNFLTADGAGGITEFDDMLFSMWDQYRLGPDTIWMSAADSRNLGPKIFGAGATPSNFRINVDMQRGAIGGGIMVGSYLNRFSMSGPTTVDLKIHPNMPQGTMLAHTNKVPYPMNNIGNMCQIRARQDYYQIDWPMRSRMYEHGVYADCVLQHYFPASMGLIQGIGNG